MASAPSTILQVIGTLAPGGAERVVVDLCRHLHGGPFRSLLCHLYPPSDLAQTPEAQGIEVVGPLATRRADPRLPLRLAAVVRRCRPHLVHLHLGPPGLWYTLAYALHLCRTPFVYTNHSVYTELPAYARVALPFTHRLARWITCVSEDSARKMVTRFPFTKGRHTVIHSGIRSSRVLPQRPRHEVRTDLAIEPEAPLICNLANVGPAKGQTTLLRAFAGVHSAHPATRLIIVGDTQAYPEITRQLRTLVAEHRLEDSVQLLAKRTDVPDLLGASDVSVLSSRWEGLPMTILEAMAAGKPVVTTNVGGCAEAVVDHETGLVVPPENPEALADALGYVLTHPAEARRMGEAGRRRVEEHFTVEAMVGKHVELYERLLA
ncbi:MAG: glycosyltransferase [Armatimonadetes bacterium]|nr:glycosyltransferase [Armatimonadota bacterium]